MKLIFEKLKSQKEAHNANLSKSIEAPKGTSIRDEGKVKNVGRVPSNNLESENIIFDEDSGTSITKAKSMLLDTNQANETLTNKPSLTPSSKQSKQPSTKSETESIQRSRARTHSYNSVQSEASKRSQVKEAKEPKELKGSNETKETTEPKESNESEEIKESKEAKVEAAVPPVREVTTLPQTNPADVKPKPENKPVSAAGMTRPPLYQAPDIDRKRNNSATPANKRSLLLSPASTKKPAVANMKTSKVSPAPYPPPSKPNNPSSNSAQTEAKVAKALPKQAEKSPIKKELNYNAARNRVASFESAKSNEGIFFKTPSPTAAPEKVDYQSILSTILSGRK